MKSWGSSSRKNVFGAPCVFRKYMSRTFVSSYENTSLHAQPFSCWEVLGWVPCTSKYTPKWRNKYYAHQLRTERSIPASSSGDGPFLYPTASCHPNAMQPWISVVSGFRGKRHHKNLRTRHTGVHLVFDPELSK